METKSIRQCDRGFTLIEMIIVALLIGVVAAVSIPRALKTTPRQAVERASQQLVQDLEQARMRAIASKRKVRMSFDPTNDFYAAFMDITGARTGDINETEDEARRVRLVVRGSQGGIPGVELSKDVKFGAGAATVGPLGETIGGDPIGLPSDQVEFDTRGMVTPLGTNGVVFLTHANDNTAVAAVTISGAGAFRAWRYRDGQWE